MSDVKEAPAQIDYEKQGTDFLARFDLHFKAAPSGDKQPPWAKPGESHGTHYTVTISRGVVMPAPKISFDFWGSIHDREERRRIRPYDVLACISGDLYCPDTFDDFCAEYGYDRGDTDKEEWERRSIFEGCRDFAKRLRSFFTPEEIEELSKIR